MQPRDADGQYDRLDAAGQGQPPADREHQGHSQSVKPNPLPGEVGDVTGKSAPV